MRRRYARRRAFTERATGDVLRGASTARNEIVTRTVTPDPTAIVNEARR
jgi:hypothetical protein